MNSNYRKMKLCFHVEKIANHLKKELYLKVLEVYESKISKDSFIKRIQSKTAEKMICIY